MTVIASAQPAAPPETVPAPSSPVPSRENKGTATEANFSLTKRLPPPPSTAKPTADDYSGDPKYRIGPEDVLHISVWGNEELTRNNFV